MLVGTEKVKKDLLSERLTNSREMFERSKQVIPGGVSANIKYFAPHPIVMERAKGSKLYDVDKNEYIDYLLVYGSLILGHGHSRVNEAVFNQLTDKGTAVYGTPHHLEMEMAEKTNKSISWN